MKYIAIDIETIGLHPYNGSIWMIAINNEKKIMLYENCNGLKQCPAQLRKLLEDKTICKVIHNGQFDMPYIELTWGICIRNVWDTMVTEKNIQGVTIDDRKVSENFKAAHSASLFYTLKRYGFKTYDKTIRENFINRPIGVPFTEAEKKYAKNDVRDLLKLQKAQEYLAIRDGQLEKILLDNKVVEKVSRMRVLGIGVDEKKWLKVAEKNLQKYETAKRSLPCVVENWNSPAQVKFYFQHRHNITIDSFVNIKKIYIKSRNPELGLFIKVRDMYSDATGYGKTWLYRDDATSYVDDDGRVRSSFDQNKNTGRFSTSDPNILGMPREGDHRSCIISRPGYSFVIGDFTGHELAIMAAASGETLWQNALLRGDDVHALMASILSPERWHTGRKKNCTFPKKCKCPDHISQRIPAKESNFLLAYGGGSSKLLERIIKNIFDKGLPTDHDMEMVMSEKESAVFVKRHKRAIPKLVRYLNKNGSDAIKTGVSYSADPYRSRRVLQGAESWQVRNQGMNNPIQAAGANCLKLALISMPDEFNIVLPFHDELVAEVPDGKVKQCVKVMTKVMEDSVDYITGIHGLSKADVRVQKDYTKH